MKHITETDRHERRHERPSKLRLFDLEARRASLEDQLALLMDEWHRARVNDEHDVLELLNGQLQELDRELKQLEVLP